MKGAKFLFFKFYYINVYISHLPSYKTICVIYARNMLGTMRLALFMFLTLYFRMNDLQAVYFNPKDKYESILLYCLNIYTLTYHQNGIKHRIVNERADLLIIVRRINAFQEAYTHLLLLRGSIRGWKRYSSIHSLSIYRVPNTL